MTRADCAQVVVVGAGCAGLCAAVEAAERGLSVMLVEKLADSMLSSTFASGGYFAFVNTDLQRRQRIADDPARFRSDMELKGAPSEPALMERYLEEQIDTYYWLQDHGVQFSHVDMGIGMNVARCHATDPQRLLEVLTRAARRLGVSFRYNWPALRLDPEPHGLRVTNDSGDSLLATAAVILASGGFARNQAMLARLVPGLERVSLIDAGRGVTGDGIVMAEALGADLSSMECVRPNFYSYAFRERNLTGVDRFQHDTPVGMVYHLGGVLVTQHGARYVREDANAKDIAIATLRLPEAFSWCVFDEKIRRRALAEKTIYINPSALEKAVRADDLEQLARLAQMAPDALQSSMRSYNENCRLGAPDPLGRQYQTAQVDRPVPIEEPPFYAFPIAPNLATTFGGLKVSANAEVLDKEGLPVPGLFACGETIGGFHGLNFMTGAGLGQAAVFGRVAAQTVSRDRSAWRKVPAAA